MKLKARCEPSPRFCSLFLFATIRARMGDRLVQALPPDGAR
jgi:hypothetical protein